MLNGLPMTRSPECPFNPAAELARIRAESPLIRMKYPNGHEGWLATGRATVRAVLSDQRFSARTELMNMPEPGPFSEMALPAAQPGDFTGVDQPEHSRYRRLLTGQFTVRRMRQLTERVEQITAEHLDAIERQGPPADLVQAFAQPIPALMICELLGVPYSDREMFQREAALVTSQEPTPEQFGAAMARMQEYMGKLVAAKRAGPTDDLLSGLTTTGLTDQELTNIGILLLAAGLGTTTHMLVLGTLAVLRRPDHIDALRGKETVGQAVEELLRYLSIVPFVLRVAIEDVELDGQLIKAGESVTLSLNAANRDPLQFADPDTLDLHRQAGGHVAFGHGIHQCLGQQLARIEMQVAFHALVNRFPALRLAVPFEDLPVGSTSRIFDVQKLPVIWDS